MRERLRLLLGIPLAALLALLAPPAYAQVALGGTVGSQGIGAELTVGLAGSLNARLGAHGFDYSERRVAGHIDYDATAHLRSASALLDWHPGGGGFRVSAGGVWNGTDVTGRSRPSAAGTYDIAGVQVPVAVVERLDARADFNRFVPYAGLGWGNAVAPGSRWGFSFEVGAVFQGKASVQLTPVIPAGSPINTVPGARQALDILIERERQEIEHDASKYDTYPVVSLGVSYRF